MGTRPALHKDGAYTSTLVVVDSSTEYQASGFDLKSSESTLKDLRIVVRLSGADIGDPLNFQLLGDVDSTIDVSSVLYYVTSDITEDGLVFLPIPKDFAHQFVGVSCIAQGTGAEAIVEELFLDTYNV